MSIEKSACLLFAIPLLAGCVAEPEGAVAVNVSSSLLPDHGLVEFEVSKQFEDARLKSSFDLVSSVVVRDDGGSLVCSAPPVASGSDGLWLDFSGNRWVALEAKSKVSYVRTDGWMQIEQNGLPTTRCNVEGRRHIKLNFLFDARPRPRGWSGEGMHGFEVSIPEVTESEPKS